MSSTHDRLLRILEHGHPIESDPGTEIMAAWQRGFNAAMGVAIGAVRSDRLNELAKSARLADEADWMPSVDADFR